MAGIPQIDAATLQRLSPMPRLIAALRAAFAAGQPVPARTQHAIGDRGTLLLMPAWQAAGQAAVQGDGLIGVKVATVFPAARPAVRATYLLLDGGDGTPRAVLDGAALTARRTAAASALAADLLARRDAGTLLVIGTGTLCLPLIEAHRTVRPLTRVLIWGRDFDKAQRRAEEARAAGHPAAATSGLEPALAEAELVSVATLATAPLLFGAALRPGMHVDLVGAFRPSMCEADPDCFRRATVFVDTREGAFSEAGDLLQAFAAGALARGDVAADLAELCRGDHPGRTGDDAITLFKSVGTALEDLALGTLVYAAWMAERGSA